MADRRNIAVIGLGTFGSALAKELTRMGDRVLGMDIDERVVAAHNGDIDVVVTADATDPKVLDHAGFDSFDAAIVCIGDNMQASLLAAMAARRSGCPLVKVKAQTPEHAQILRAMGVEHILEPEQSAALHTARLLHNPKLIDFLDLGNGNYVAAMHAPIARHCERVSDLKLAKFGLACVGIDIGERIVTLDLDAHDLKPSDKLILVLRRDALRDFAVRG